MLSTPHLFTTIKVINGNPIAFNQHLEKLKMDYASLFKKELTVDEDEIMDQLKQDRYQKGVWRLNIFTEKNSYYRLTQEPPLKKKSFSIKIYPKPFYEKFPMFKKQNFSQRMTLLEEAHEQGYDDYLFTDENGFFLETCICNIFWIKDKTVYTPSHKLPLYRGITLQNTLKSLEKMGYEIREIFEKDLSNLSNSNLFVCNSMKGLIPVNQLNDLELKLAIIDALQST